MNMFASARPAGQHRLWQVALIITVGVLLLGTLVSHPARAASEKICFPGVPGVQNCIEGRFAEFWTANGGLPVFGYPLTSAQVERNRDTGQVYLTQYFERQRFELHGDQGRPYDVLLGRLGDDSLRKQGRDWQQAPKAAPSSAHYFAATGHAIGAEFWEYWRNHGLEVGDAGMSERESLALFGLPITEPAFETNSSGDRVLTQYFERARLEFHASKPAASRTLQGRLGDEVRGRQPGDYPPPASTRTPDDRRTRTAEPSETHGPDDRTRTAEPSETHGPDDRTRTAEPDDDRTRTAEPDDDRTRTAEPDDDRTRTAEPDDDRTRTAEPQETRTAEPQETEHPDETRTARPDDDDDDDDDDNSGHH